MKDNLKFEVKNGQTHFVLKEGTKVRVGQEELVLAEDTEVISGRILSRDGVVETLVGGGAGGANAANFAYVDERENAETGKKEKYLVTYGGAGNRKEKLMEKGDELPKAPKVDAEQIADQALIEDLDNSIVPKPDISASVVEDMKAATEGKAAKSAPKRAPARKAAAKSETEKKAKADAADLPEDQPTEESNVEPHKE